MEVVVVYFSEISRNLRLGSEENHKIPQSGYFVSQSGLDLGTSK
jgi:hypothetical protein